MRIKRDDVPNIPNDRVNKTYFKLNYDWSDVKHNNNCSYKINECQNLNQTFYDFLMLYTITKVILKNTCNLLRTVIKV